MRVAIAVGLVCLIPGLRGVPAIAKLPEIRPEGQ
jgi:hypothetical protein